jgi:hypothetical protein
MKTILFILAFFMSTHAALAVEPPSAMPSGLPDAATAKAREAADYSIIVQADKWVAGPSFVNGAFKWYLHAKIESVIFAKFAQGGNGPFAVDGDVLIIPYCSQGSVNAPGGPGNGCAAFVDKKMQIWGLLSDMHAQTINDGKILIQAENLLDAAFIP